MDGVALDAGGEVRADGAGGCFRGVCRAHDLAVLRDGVFSFEDHDEDGAGNHKVDEFLVKGPLFVDRVKGFCLVLRHVEHFGGDNTEAVSFKIFNDVPNHILTDRVGLDDRKRLLQSLSCGVGHRFSNHVKLQGHCNPAGNKSHEVLSKMWRNI